MELIFATNNKHKLEEIQAIIGSSFKILSLNDIGFSGDIPETQPTIEGNALQKAEYIFERFNKPVFADDTGLEVIALNEAPGVYSARYAGPDCSFSDNVNLLLKNLLGHTDRSSRFKTVIALKLSESHLKLFEGIIEGVITEKILGEGGFGYDPIFKPKGFSETFSEMSTETKNRISHRGLATQKLVSFLKELNEKI
ncbi:MAG: non-canonical purine NTP pyrophosphatase, RdgB/HAM1 family [Crocinitomicaceae bacterium]|jgi:XTP/dITP diphosphohydrolase|nr:non-canonical purine NTP pyrophosphatase, RdgB/HAM1 family [Crocinitomicaceae bacterium]|tara:strand:- start:87083 stop:87673 length:591 start_codon:yes stop_codon:yes gene_type:complete